MFTNDTLRTLQLHSAAPAVSLFVPTSPSGPETTAASTHLATLVKEANALLIEHGVSETDAEALLSPAQQKVSDASYWQHQQHGLALFVNAGGLVEVSVDHPLSPQVFVGDHFDVLPVLLGLASAGQWGVVCASEAEVTTYRATPRTMERISVDGLPASLDAVAADSDYENPVFASPPSRPNTGSQNISNAQVYGDAPPEWQAKVRRAFAEKIASALTASADLSGLPLVLIADEKLAGDLGRSLTTVAVDTTHPDSLTDSQRHELSHTHVRPILDRGRQALLDTMAQQLGRGEGVASDPAEIAELADQSRIATLFVGRSDPDATISRALWATLANGGDVVWSGDSPAMPDSGVVALLRY